MVFRVFILACFSILSSYSLNAQTIIVNGSSVSIANTDVTFPFWLDSGSTIEVGDHVISISALEFNIVPNNNGNSLVYVQTKLITTLETVPNGKTWKLEGVLLDSTINNNNTNSSQVIVSGGLSVIDLSGESPNTMNFGAALDYCDNLTEGGNEDWILPNYEDLMHAIGGGVSISYRNNNLLWTSTKYNDLFNHVNVTNTNGNEIRTKNVTDLFHVRCVRIGNVNVTSSSSSGSNVSSSLGNNMPTMISNESVNTMSWGESILYCDSLIESGYSDWIMPSTDQLTYAISGGCTISDTRTDEYIWTRTIDQVSSSGLVHAVALARNISTSNQTSRRYSDPSTKIKCRCVR